MIHRIAGSALFWLAGFAGLAILLLSLPLRLPLGANYWDLYTYVDTAYRIQLGQLPHVDFFVPVGPLGYYLYAMTAGLFSQAHTLLSVQYAILIVTLPVMTIIAAHVDRRSRVEALALVVPYILFSALPVNVVELYPSPGLDGFGNYNRHTAILLYLLSCSLLFVSNRAMTGVLVIVLLAALFLTKITGFVIGVILVVQGLLTGRTSRSWAVGTAFAIVALLLAVEARTAMISHYVIDIKELAAMNTGALLPRILTVLSVKLDVILPALILVAMLAWRGRTALAATSLTLFKERSMQSFRMLADHHCVWLLALLIGGLVFETQNTGSIEFLLLWPALLLVLLHMPFPWSTKSIPVLVLIGAVALPTPGVVLHRAARAIFSMPKYEAVKAPLLGPIGRVSAKPEIMLQANALRMHYAASRFSYEQMAARHVLPSYILFSEIDFQVSWLLSTQEAAEALLRYEAEKNVRYEAILTLDFVDPMPVILGRKPLRDISIGNDPERTLGKLGPRVIAEIRNADAILLPTCPVTSARKAIFNVYASHLNDRRSVALTPCFDMLVKN